MNIKYLLSKDGLVLCQFNNYDDLSDFITHINEYEIAGVQTEDDLKKINVHIYASIDNIKDNFNTFSNIFKTVH